MSEEINFNSVMDMIIKGKFGFKSYTKIKDYIQKMFPTVKIDEKQLKAYYKTIPNLNVPHSVQERRATTLQVSSGLSKPYFSRQTGTYQMDLMFNHFDDPKDRNKLAPDGFLIVINVNTRFLYATPITDKHTQTLKEAFVRFYNSKYVNGSVSRVYCDGEKGFNSNEFKDFCEYHRIELNTIPNSADRHKYLCFVNRVIRTLRDMIYVSDTNNKTKDEELQQITTESLQSLIKQYNDIEHCSTGMSPIDMMTDKKAEKAYIIHCLTEGLVEEKPSNVVKPGDEIKPGVVVIKKEEPPEKVPKPPKVKGEMKIGDHVQLVKAKKDFQKSRFKLTKGYVVIIDKIDDLYAVEAGDKSCLFVKGERLMPIDPIKKIDPQPHIKNSKDGNDFYPDKLLGQEEVIKTYDDGSKKKMIKYIFQDRANKIQKYFERDFPTIGKQFFIRLINEYRKAQGIKLRRK